VSGRPAGDRGDPNERGAVLILALLLMMLLGVIGAGLITVTMTETLIAASYRHAMEASSGAEAALERALHDLAAIPDWSVVLEPPPAPPQSTFNDGAAQPRSPDGGTLNLSGLTADRQRESDARDGPSVFGADSPRWRLFAHAPIADLFRAGQPVPPVYLVVWVADDGGDGDGDPERDVNETVLVHAAAFGSGGGRRAVEASVGRSPDGLLVLRSWHRVP
jgi:hypothetical protein